MEIIYANQEADSKKLQFFKISWNGKWDNDPVSLFKCLNIEEVTDEVNKDKDSQTER